MHIFVFLHPFSIDQISIDFQYSSPHCTPNYWNSMSHQNKRIYHTYLVQNRAFTSDGYCYLGYCHFLFDNLKGKNDYIVRYCIFKKFPWPVENRYYKYIKSRSRVMTLMFINEKCKTWTSIWAITYIHMSERKISLKLVMPLFTQGHVRCYLLVFFSQLTTHIFP